MYLIHHFNKKDGKKVKNLPPKKVQNELSENRFNRFFRFGKETYKSSVFEILGLSI